MAMPHLSLAVRWCAVPWGGNQPVAAVAPASRADVAAAVGPRPGFAELRNRNRRSRVMLLGRAPSACFEEQGS